MDDAVRGWDVPGYHIRWVHFYSPCNTKNLYWNTCLKLICSWLILHFCCKLIRLSVIVNISVLWGLWTVCGEIDQTECWLKFVDQKKLIKGTLLKLNDPFDVSKVVVYGLVFEVNQIICENCLHFFRFRNFSTKKEDNGFIKMAFHNSDFSCSCF